MVESGLNSLIWFCAVKLSAAIIKGSQYLQLHFIVVVYTQQFTAFNPHAQFTVHNSKSTAYFFVCPTLHTQSKFTSHSSESVVVMAEGTSHNQSPQFIVCSFVIICDSHLVVDQQTNLLQVNSG